MLIAAAIVAIKNDRCESLSVRHKIDAYIMQPSQQGVNLNFSATPMSILTQQAPLIFMILKWTPQNLPVGCLST